MICSRCGIGLGDIEKATKWGDTFMICSRCNNKILEAEKIENNRKLDYELLDRKGMGRSAENKND